MSRLRYLLLGLVLFALCLPAQAIITGELMMLRSVKPFDEAMESLQRAIEKQGYSVTGVRRVDQGLAESGYKSDKYRIVFFEKTGEVDALTNSHPELLPYLPLKIVVFAEAGETLLVTADPATFNDLFSDPRLKDLFNRWHDDVVNIIQAVQNQ